MLRAARRALLWLLPIGAVGPFGASRLYAAIAGAAHSQHRRAEHGKSARLTFGALAYVEPAGRYRVGDVATYRDSGYNVTHRIVADASGDPDNPWWVTKGDANDKPDGAWLRDKQIVGKVVGYVPWLGVATKLVAHPPLIAFVVLLVALVALWPQKEPARPDAKAEPPLSRRTF